MADSVQVKVDAISASQFQSALAALQERLHRSPGQAVKTATSFFLRSIAARTRVAKRYPQLEKVTIGKRQYWKIKNDRAFPSERSKWKWSVKTTSAKQVKKYNERVYAGLAKRMWFIASKKTVRVKTQNPKVSYKRRVDAIHVRKNLKGDNPFVDIDNRLGYATDALTSGGALNDALEAASRSMMKYINDTIEKRK